MSRRADIDLMRDIKESISRINSYIGGLSYEDFFKDTKTQDAAARNLEIIGEAAKNISGDFRRRHPQVPWKELAGLRDRLIHHYFGVNLDIIWSIIKDELPGLLQQIQAIFDKK